MRIRTQLVLLILTAGIVCISLFQFLWMHKWEVWEFMSKNISLFSDIFPDLDEDFWTTLHQEALNYNVPDSEEDVEAVEAIQPFFDLADEYTSIYIYGLEDGTYRAGQAPGALVSASALFRTPFDAFYRLTDGAVEMEYRFPLEFKNGYAEVIVYFYHRTQFVILYFLFCLALSIILFFAVILFFIGRKMNSVILLQKDILRMASGDLSTPVPAAGHDEIGILAQELDHLRLALQETFAQEQESHKANRDLVAALSHDLRTPLTVLKGYLEVLKLNPDPAMQERCISQCLEKTDDIREMTDRIFEYALVYDETDSPVLSQLSADVLLHLLTENIDFLHLTGFHTEPDLPEDTNESFTGDPAMIKRIFNNLFSNIIKYGDKEKPVFISAAIKNRSDMEAEIVITLQNTIKSDLSGISSTQIGLKSTRKMMELMNGTLDTEEKETLFTARLAFPCQKNAL